MLVRVLQDQLLYPFHIQHVQALQRRNLFFKWLPQWDAASPTFLSLVFLMDEAYFIWNGILKFITSAHGLMKIQIPFKKHNSNRSLQ
jgi:hypothetical protein